LVLLAMDYTTYLTEDFLADESFQSFVAGDNPTTVRFWRAWIKQHPAKEPELNEAVVLLRMLAHRQSPPLPEGLKRTETAKFWQAINS
nr:hypothetical protein [Tanacetum cinerariifolium]